MSRLTYMRACDPHRYTNLGVPNAAAKRLECLHWALVDRAERSLGTARVH